MSTDRPTGEDRTDDDLLSLDEAAMPRRALMVGMVDAMYSACLVGNPAPNTAAVYERMTTPRPGDLVVEMSNPRDPDRAYRGFGILLDQRVEGYDVVWYVQYGPAAGDVCRWVNASFVAVVTERPAASVLGFGETE